MVVTLRRYWFVTAYLILYAVAPFLNITISAMDRRSHFLLCATLLFIYCFLHNLVYICDFGGLAGGTNLLWFGTLYLVAAYIRKYVPARVPARRSLIVYAVCVCSLVLWRALTLWLTPKLFGTTILTGLLQTRSSVPVTIGSIALFLAMRSLTLHGKLLTQTISFFAPLSFAVYLIHEQPELRPILWDTLHPSTYANSPWMLLHMVVSIFGIFVICCLIEYGRLWLFRLLRIDQIIKSISEKVKSISDSMLNKWGI